jgi:hypothetical protein
MQFQLFTLFSSALVLAAPIANPEAKPQFGMGMGGMGMMNPMMMGMGGMGMMGGMGGYGMGMF